MSRQRAELRYQQAELDFKEAEARIWTEFNRKRAELRANLERDVRNGNVANPDSVDHSGLELMKSGVLSVDDYYALMKKYDDNPTMLRFVAKYAKGSCQRYGQYPGEGTWVITPFVLRMQPGKKPDDAGMG